MGCLEHQASGRRVTLGPRCLIGRAEHCTLEIDNPKVSGEHATLRYRRKNWMLRDLGSSNGTEIDGKPLLAGSEIMVRAGAVMAFGSRDERWKLVDDAGPAVLARRLSDGEVRRLEGGELLALPDMASPECQIFAHDEQGWVAELNGETRLVVDQQRLQLSCGEWQLELPPIVTELVTTHEARELPRNLRSATLQFAVSLDRAHVELTIIGSDWQVSLGSRTYNEMLLVLAEARMKDRRAHPDISSAEHGWLHVDDLCKLADVKDDKRIDQYVFHARKQLARARIDGSAQIVDRTRKGQLRLGVEKVRITSL